MAERLLTSNSSDTMAFMANLATSNLDEPRGDAGAAEPFFSTDSPRESYLNATPNDSGTLLGPQDENLAQEDPILPISPTTTTTTTSPKDTIRRVRLATSNLEEPRGDAGAAESFFSTDSPPESYLNATPNDYGTLLGPKDVNIAQEDPSLSISPTTTTTTTTTSPKDTMAFMANSATSNFEEPRGVGAAGPFLSTDSPRESYFTAIPDDSGTLLGPKNENVAREDPILSMSPTPSMTFMANLATSNFDEPRGAGPFLSTDSPRESYLNATPNDSGTLLGPKNENLAQEDPILPTTTTTSPAKSKRRIIITIVLLLSALIVVIVAVIVPVYFTVIRPKLDRSSGKKSSSGGSSGSSGGSGGSGGSNSGGPSGSTPKGSSNAITGGDGSTIYAANGTTFTYHNSFGGFWYADPNDPFNLNARPNSWTPPLNQSWDFTANRINGVNLGGWFVLEPFISPTLFQKYPGAVDEWTLSTLMAADTSPGGGLGQIEDHYNTFITEQDIAEIAGAGLNWVRIPIPFWAIDVWEGEPFLARTSWKYIVQALQWCRKYGIRVNLDLHTIPGSQNGYNHSGKEGQIDFLHGIMGMANAQRTMNYIRIITEFISQDEWKDVVIMFGIINEALITTIGTTELRGFYVEVYEMMRGITGLGAGNGPYMSIHDGFQGLEVWAGFLTGADRLTLDTHPYFAFNGQPNTATIDTGTGPGAGGTWPAAACADWGPPMNASRIGFGTTIAGEYSNGINDCGLFLLGVGTPATYPGNCAEWQDSSQWTAGTKAGILQLALSSMDALGDSFFWTWKVGNSSAGIVESPLWSYQLGLQGGWMPTDPRAASGVCGPPAGPVFSSFLPWMTGGAGAGVIAAAQTAQYPYPPSTLEDTPYSASLLPSYTSTGPISTLPPPTYTNTKGATINAGNGWFDAQDKQAAPTPIAGCNYPNAWDALSAALPPAGVCGGAATPAAGVVPVAATSVGVVVTATATTTLAVANPIVPTTTNPPI